MRATYLTVVLLACSGAEAPATQPTPNEAPTTQMPREAGDPCPLITAAADSISAGGVPPSVAGDDVTTDLDALAAALPETAANLTRTETSTMPRGAAGHWSPIVLTFYEAVGVRVGVEVNDLVHVCSCESGMGETLLERRVAAGATRTLVANRPAVRGAGPPPELEVWVNDRCSVRLWAAPADVLERLAGSLDWAALSAACPAR